MNAIPALPAAAPIAPHAAPNSPVPQNDCTESFDAALQREVQTRQTPDDRAATSAIAAAPTSTEQGEINTEAVPDEAQIHEDVQALIASLTMLPPQKATDPAQPVSQRQTDADDTKVLLTATDKPGQPMRAATEARDSGDSGESGENADIPTTTPARNHQQAADWQPRTETAAQTTAQTKPENAAASTAAAAPDSHAAALQATPVMAGAPLAAPFTLQESPARPTPHLAPRVGNPGWDQALGQRVLWLAGSGNQQASLTINPPQLGPVQVTLQVHDKQAIASFVSAQPEVRQALEAAMPKLREMMVEAGLQLSHAQVHAGGHHEAPHERSANHAQQRSAIPHPVATGSQETHQATGLMNGLGLVDTFA